MRWRVSIGLLVFLFLALYFQVEAFRLTRSDAQRVANFCVLGHVCRTQKDKSPHPELYRPGQKYAFVDDSGKAQPIREAMIHYALSPAAVSASIQSSRVLVFHNDAANAEPYAAKHGLKLLDQLDKHIRLYEKKEE